MTTRKVVLGKRANGDMGLFVSKGAADALVADDSLLSISIGTKVSNLILLGRAGAGTTVHLGLANLPIVMVTSLNTLTSLPHLTSEDGPCRPSPLPITTGVTWNSGIAIYGNGADMFITGYGQVVYAVYSSRLV